MANFVRIEILLFAGVAERVGQRSVSVDLEVGATIEDLQKLFSAQFPEVHALSEVSRWAVENQFADRSHVFEADTQVALIPPVSGG